MVDPIAYRLQTPEEFAIITISQSKPKLRYKLISHTKFPGPQVLNYFLIQNTFALSSSNRADARDFFILN